MAEVLHDRTNSKILVRHYTNHVLDQFLEDLMKINIPSSSIVRWEKLLRPPNPFNSRNTSSNG